MDEGSDPARALGLPYDGLKTRQVIGSEAEIKMAKDHGARPHPRSGAGRIKDDASNETEQFEFKNVMKTHTLNGADLLALFRRGVRLDKQPQYVIHFEGVNIIARITLERGPRR